MAMNAWGGGIRLRPLDIGDVLDETFRVYKRGFVPFITIMALVIVPTTLIMLLATILLIGIGVGASRSSFFNNLSPEAGTALLGAGIGAALLMILFAIAASVAQMVAAGAIVRAASNTVLGEPIVIREAYRETFSRVGSMVLSSLCVAIPLMLLVVTCIGIPVAVFVGLGWSLIYQAILLEGHGAIDAMRRSWELVTGHRWRLLVSFVLIGLIQWLLLSVPSGIFTFLGAGLVALSGDSLTVQLGVQVVQMVASAAGQVLFTPIGLITATLIYYDLRVRKEAFDLQQRLPGVEIVQPTQQYAPGYPPQSPQYPGQMPRYPQHPPQNPPYPQQQPQRHDPRYPQQPPNPPQIPPPPPAPPAR